MFLCPPPTPPTALEFLAGSAYTAVSFQKYLLGHVWPRFSDIPEMSRLICTSPHLTDHSGSTDLQSNSPQVSSTICADLVARDKKIQKMICSWFMETRPLVGKNSTDMLLRRGQITPVILIYQIGYHSNSSYQLIGHSFSVDCKTSNLPIKLVNIS